MIDQDVLEGLKAWADARDLVIDAIVIGAAPSGAIIAAYEPERIDYCYFAARLDHPVFGDTHEWFVRDIAVKATQAEAFAAMAEL